VPHINHPNFNWSITPEQLGAVKNNKLFEIYNGHPMVNNFGGGGMPGTEAAWDVILSSGTLLYGIAVDDAHHFKDLGNPKLAGPGRGWVMVRAATLSARAILDAMERGNFYASTGVELDGYEVTTRSMTVTVKRNTFASTGFSSLRKAAWCCMKRSTARPPTRSAEPKATSARVSSTATARSPGVNLR